MILLLAPEAAERGELATLLEQLGHQVTVHAPAGVPPALTAPERCDVIVLTSTPVRMPQIPPPSYESGSPYSRGLYRGSSAAGRFVGSKP